jgi:heme/copper-type cytochrome/quinol oxidase subunit 2
MHPVTYLLVGLFFAILYLRYRSRRRKTTRTPRQQQLRTVTLLLAALAVWMVAHYSIQHALAKMDGTDQEPSFLDRAVSFWSK